MGQLKQSLKMLSKAEKSSPNKKSKSFSYSRFKQINGTHPFKSTFFTHVAYPVKPKKHGKIAYFNFSLAKEMGLLSKTHPEKLTDGLTRTLLSCFSIEIINEHEMMKNRKWDQSKNCEQYGEEEVIATRYLQLQHPGRSGVSSGDGRSVWNGFCEDKKGRTWDITSCGTGATCLSPATALSGKYFETGDPTVSYGCGLNSLQEGLVDVMFSEILHSQDIATERVLCVIEYPNKQSISVRAGQNLLRPSHFFNHLKQGRQDRLKSIFDYHYNRLQTNENFDRHKTKKSRYNFVTNRFAQDLAHAIARFEEEYLFCWLDWDGDNILMDGGIIDYGSVRLFGMFHHRYRFKDTEKWSTNIKEQRKQGRKTVQAFAQAVDFVLTGVKKPLDEFFDCKFTRRFDQELNKRKRRFFLRRCGYSADQIDHLNTNLNARHFQTFEALFYNLEAQLSRNGEQEVPDGITTPALVNMRAFLRELPILLQSNHSNEYVMEELFKIIQSSYLERESPVTTETILEKLEMSLHAYKNMITSTSNALGTTPRDLLASIKNNVVTIHPVDRVTGDAIFVIGQKISEATKKLGFDGTFKVINEFIYSQTSSSKTQKNKVNRLEPREKKILHTLKDLAYAYREGL